MMKRKICVECKRALVPDSDNPTARAAQGLGLCYSCYGTDEIRQARRELVGYPKASAACAVAGKASAKARAAKALTNAPKRSTCVHCGERAVPEGETCSAKAARGLSLCYTCYRIKDVRHARRAKVGYPSSSTRRAKDRKGRPAKQLPPPASSGGAAPPARRKRRSGAVASPVVAPAGTVDVRTGVAEVLRREFSRFACAELRAMADEIEETSI